MNSQPLVHVTKWKTQKRLQKVTSLVNNNLKLIEWSLYYNHFVGLTTVKKYASTPRSEQTKFSIFL